MDCCLKQTSFQAASQLTQLARPGSLDKLAFSTPITWFSKQSGNQILLLPFSRCIQEGGSINALYNEYIQSTVDKLLLLVFTMLLWPVLFVQPSRWSLAGVYIVHTRQEGRPLLTRWPPSRATTPSDSLQLSSRTRV